MRSVAIQSPSQATVSPSALPQVNDLKFQSIIPTSRVLQENTSDGNTELILSFYLWILRQIKSFISVTYILRNTNLTKQSTGIKILENAGHRNPEILKYEGFIWSYIYSWFVISIFFFTITIYMCVIQNSMPIYFCPIYYDHKTFNRV